MAIVEKQKIKFTTRMGYETDIYILHIYIYHKYIHIYKHTYVHIHTYTLAIYTNMQTYHSTGRLLLEICAISVITYGRTK